MSCCTIKKDESSKSLLILKQHFDVVEVEDLDKYRTLTLKNKTNQVNYDWTIWLQVKIPYGNTQERGAPRTDNELLEGVCKSISDWIELLLNFDKSNHGKQLSLFGEEEDEFEKEPESPKYGEDRAWSTYFKKCNQVKINNLKKRYTFFELCDLNYAWYSYKDIDWSFLLPQSNKEMIELVKDAILKGIKTPEGHTRDYEYWWDNEYNYIKEGDSLSDYELIARVKQLIRLYLVPFTREFHVSTDLSYSSWEFEKQTNYRYWFDGKKIIGNSWNDGKGLPEYDLYDKDFILWLRELFEIKEIEPMSDDEILKANIEQLIASLTGYESDYNLESEVNKTKDFKEFKKNFYKYLKDVGRENHSGGGSGFSKDSFHGSLSRDKKLNIDIQQVTSERIKMGRDIDNLESAPYNDDRVIVFNLSGDDIFKESFRLFKTNGYRQSTIFDFLVA